MQRLLKIFYDSYGKCSYGTKNSGGMTGISAAKKGFPEFLLSRPNFGDGQDFKREQDGAIENVFD